MNNNPQRNLQNEKLPCSISSLPKLINDSFNDGALDVDPDTIKYIV